MGNKRVALKIPGTKYQIIQEVSLTTKYGLELTNRWGWLTISANATQLTGDNTLLRQEEEETWA